MQGGRDPMTRCWPYRSVVTKVLGLAGGVLLLIAGSVASGSGTDSDVTIKTFQFKPIVVKAGTRVTWTNADEITVTSGTPENRDGQFSAPLAGKGTTFSVIFSKPGTYPYFCERHPSMRGEIRVN